MIEANNDEVICPNCVHQFRAIPVNVQKELAAAQTIQWPVSDSVRRRDDMSAADVMQVGIDESGDLQLSLWTSEGGYSSVEFCSGAGGGGRSPNTRKALIALMVAMEADNAVREIT